MDVDKILSFAGTFEKSVETLRTKDLPRVPESEPEIEVITPPTDKFSRTSAEIGALLFKVADKVQYLAGIFFSYNRAEITDYQVISELIEAEELLSAVNKKYGSLIS